jgi:osmotically-inducible protein OsmY
MSGEIEVRLPLSIKRGDEEIASAAVSRLAWNGSVPNDAVKPKVEKGWITLTGEVDWHFQQEAVADGVRGLYGVVGVSNLITIKPRPTHRTLGTISRSRCIAHGWTRGQST